MDSKSRPPSTVSITADKIDRPLALLASPVSLVDFVGVMLIEFFDPIGRFVGSCFC